MRNDHQRFLDISESLALIQKYTNLGRAEFDASELVQTWVLHHLQIIGEASRAISAECKAKYPDVPWGKINGMRNILVHQYFGVDGELIWSVVENDFPPLIENIAQILDQSTTT